MSRCFIPAHAVAYRTHRERGDDKTTHPVMLERFEKMLRVNVPKPDGKPVIYEIY